MTESLHPEETITTIIFVRHGHTLQTEQGKLYSDHAALLTDRGLKQAEAVANWLQKERTELLLSSTADRVLGTAQIISKQLSLEIEKLPGLDEQNVGEWEGRSYLEIKKSDPDLYKAWCQDPVRNRAPGGESLQDVYERVAVYIADIIAKHPGKKITLTTHAGVIRSAIISALQMPIDNFWRISIPTGSATKIDYSNNFATMQFMSYRFD